MEKLKELLVELKYKLQDFVDGMKAKMIENPMKTAFVVAVVMGVLILVFVNL